MLTLHELPRRSINEDLFMGVYNTIVISLVAVLEQYWYGAKIINGEPADNCCKTSLYGRLSFSARFWILQYLTEKNLLKCFLREYNADTPNVAEKRMTPAKFAVKISKMP